MATIYLLRHAHSVANGAGILAGRSVGNPLSKVGILQAEEIKRALCDEEFAAIYVSPLQRCLQSVDPLAKSIRKRPQRSENFLEMNYGSWTGQPLKDLRKEPLWRDIQREPSKVRFPKGESFLAARSRIVRGLNEIEKKHRNQKVLVVTHGDVIKIALTAALGLELDRFQRMVIDPASLSIVDWRSKSVLQVNSRITKKRNPVAVAARRALGGGSNI